MAGSLSEALGFSVDADLAPFVAKMAILRGAVGSTAKKMGGHFKTLAGSISQMITRMGILATVVGGAAVKSAMSYETAMANARTQTELTDDAWGALEQRVRGLMTQFGITDFEQAGDAVFSAFSSGAEDTEEAVELVTTAFKNWVAQGTDVGTTIKFVTQQWKIFGREGNEAAVLMDKLATATVLSKSTQQQFAQSLEQLSPIFKAGGGSQLEMFAAVSDLSQAFGNASEASTALREIMNALLTPTKLQQEAIEALNAEAMIQAGITQEQIEYWGGAEKAANAYGVRLVEFGADAIAAAGGLFPFLQNLTTRMNSSDVSTRRLVRSVQGFGALLTFAETAGEDYGKALDAMGDSAGKFEQQFQIATDTAAEGWNRLWAAIKVAGLAIVIDTGLLKDLGEALDAGAKKINAWVAEFQAWMAENPAALEQLKDQVLEWGKWGAVIFGVVGALAVLAPVFVAVWAIVGIVSSAVSLLVSGLGLLWTAVSVIGGALVATFGWPFLLIGALIAVAVAAVVWFRDEIVDMFTTVVEFGAWFAFQIIQMFGDAWDAIKGGATAVKDWIVDAFTWAADKVLSVWQGVKDWFVDLWGTVGGFFGFGGGGGSTSSQNNSTSTGAPPPTASQVSGLIGTDISSAIASGVASGISSSTSTGGAPSAGLPPIQIFIGGGLAGLGDPDQAAVTTMVREVLIPELERAMERGQNPRSPSSR